MEGSSIIKEHEEVSPAHFDVESIPTPRTSSSLHAPFKQPNLDKEPTLKTVMNNGVSFKSKYAQLHGKTFPYYDLWCELFGQHRATGSNVRDHTVAEVRKSSVPSEVFEIRDEPDEEEVQESRPTHISHTEQSLGTEKSPITTKSPSGVDGATSVSRGKRKTVCNELPPEFVDACISSDRLAKKKERIVEEESKKERLDRMADVVEEHMELNVTNRFRLIKHLMADVSGYLYFLRLDHATRRDYIHAFLDGQVD